MRPLRESSIDFDIRRRGRISHASKNTAKTVHALNDEFCSLVVYEILDSVSQYFSNILDIMKRIDLLWNLSLYFIYKLVIDNCN